MKERFGIAFEQARADLLRVLKPLDPVWSPVSEVCGLVVAEDIPAQVDCPSVTTCLKDGFAVVARDIEEASGTHPVRLRLVGRLTAGQFAETPEVRRGSAVKVMTGAPMPGGADAVLPVEFTREEGETLFCLDRTDTGRNVLFKGTDVCAGELVARKGQVCSPGYAGRIAAAGVGMVRVVPKPRMGIIAVGDEIVAPGFPLRPGQLYASNLITLSCWLRHFRMEVRTSVVPDRASDIRNAVESMRSDADVLITSGGAWKSERDLTVRILEEMGCAFSFHGIRMGPGKGVAFGVLDGTTVFCLPGGPPSNEMAFWQIALPGILALAGRAPEPFPIVHARLSEAVSGDSTWTQFIHADMEHRLGEWWVTPHRMKSRLESQACAKALISVPEGVESFPEGSTVAVQLLQEAVW